MWYFILNRFDEREKMKNSRMKVDPVSNGERARAHENPNGTLRMGKNRGLKFRIKRRVCYSSRCRPSNMLHTMIYDPACGEPRAMVRRKRAHREYNIRPMNAASTFFPLRRIIRVGDF